MPRQSLTAAAIDRVKWPKTGQVDIFDRGYPGFALRVSYGGARSFVFFYRIGRKLRRMTLGTYPAMSLADAREAWRLAREDVAKGRDPATVKKREKGATDFENVSREWLKRDQGDKRSKHEVERILEKILIPAWGHRAVADIGRRDILDLIDEIADRGALTMSRRVQAYVHRFFRWCVGRGVIEANPASDLPKHGSETKRDRVLSDDELAAVWKAAESLGWPFGKAIQLLILSAARREEIGQLQWPEISLTENPVIKLEGTRTKNGEPHDIPLSKLAATIVESLPRIAKPGATESDLVFTTNGVTSISGWTRVKQRLDGAATKLLRKSNPKAAMKPWRLHDLRRTASTGMNELGIEPHIVEAILGHTVKGVAGVYNHAKHEKAKRSALERWASHVGTLLGDEGKGVVVPLRAR